MRKLLLKSISVNPQSVSKTLRLSKSQIAQKSAQIKTSRIYDQVILNI